MSRSQQAVKTPELWALRGTAILPQRLSPLEDELDFGALTAFAGGFPAEGEPFPDQVVERLLERLVQDGFSTDEFTATPPPWECVEDAVVFVAEGLVQWAGRARNVEDALGLPDPFPWARDWSSSEVEQALREAREWEGYILPGLVDIHCHGGGGQSFPDATTVEEALIAVHEHRRHGTTSVVASLVTDAPEVLARQTGLLARLCQAGELTGIHLEGPFLSPARAGAQDPANLRDPDPELVRILAQAGAGWIVAITLAPELPGVLRAPDAAGTAVGLSHSTGGFPAGPGGWLDESPFSGEAASALLQAVADAGIVPFFGHTDCSAPQMARAVRAAIAAMDQSKVPFGSGQRPGATHLFNGMRPIHHRDPGPAMQALAEAGAGAMAVELVADGIHLDPQLVADVFRLVDSDCVVLVTDAMAAAGMADGQYQLGPMAVTVADGVARLTQGHNIAGGTAHLIDVVRSVWRDSGVPLAEAVRAAALNPARVLGREGSVGSLQQGKRADLVLTDLNLNPIEVYREGRRADLI
ncbi:MAG: amidohydrolase family protein [Bifidobacteriaceae bacterium]|nr:amidohydrolase family protein [Bifidobacteriaceae bacterium]